MDKITLYPNKQIYIVGGVLVNLMICHVLYQTDIMMDIIMFLDVFVRLTVHYLII